MGVAFYLGAGWPQWKPLEHYKHTPPILARRLVNSLFGNLKTAFCSVRTLKTSQKYSSFLMMLLIAGGI